MDLTVKKTLFESLLERLDYITEYTYKYMKDKTVHYIIKVGKTVVRDAYVNNKIFDSCIPNLEKLKEAAPKSQ